jgi:hypothetical protein
MKKDKFNGFFWDRILQRQLQHRTMKRYNLQGSLIVPEFRLIRSPFITSEMLGG